MPFQNTLAYAQSLDQKDPLRQYREQFHLPLQQDGTPYLYLCGNSLGLQPKKAQEYVMQEMEDWQKLGVEGHFHARHPWMPYHEFLTASMARVVGAKDQEVVVMNTLTTNLHLLMVSFYRPTPQRFKILIEKDAFPSDRYAVASQARFHGYDPAEAILELPVSAGQDWPSDSDIEGFIKEKGEEIALILIGGVNYYTGQYFPLQKITEWGHAKGCVVGFDLAHAAGNAPLQLHEAGCDFAAWCTYKYLNGGPGSLGGVFVHERHAHNKTLPRFEGWWGHNKDTRFNMRYDFDPIPGAEGWQLSNPPILPMASMRASLELFDQAGMTALRQKSVQLTGYFYWLLKQMPAGRVSVISPEAESARGCQLSIRVKDADKRLFEQITEAGVIADWREPDVIRVAPVPMYNTYEEVFRFVEILNHCIS